MSGAMPGRRRGSSDSGEGQGVCGINEARGGGGGFGGVEEGVQQSVGAERAALQARLLEREREMLRVVERFDDRVRGVVDEKLSLVDQQRPNQQVVSGKLRASCEGNGRASAAHMRAQASTAEGLAEGRGQSHGPQSAMERRMRLLEDKVNQLSERSNGEPKGRDTAAPLSHDTADVSRETVSRQLSLTGCDTAAGVGAGAVGAHRLGELEGEVQRLSEMRTPAGLGTGRVDQRQSSWRGRCEADMSGASARQVADSIEKPSPSLSVAAAQDRELQHALRLLQRSRADALEQLQVRSRIRECIYRKP